MKNMNYEHYETLLISEDTIKTETTLDDNLQGKNLMPAIYRAQEIYLQEMIGTKLYRKLQELVYNDNIELQQYEDYKYILDVFIQPYLAELVLANVSIESAAKIANAGVVTPSDAGHYYQASKDERLRLIEMYKNNAAHYANMLEKYLIHNHSKFQDLDGTKCDELKHHLNSAADTSIYLGGSRGRKINTSRL